MLSQNAYKIDLEDKLLYSQQWSRQPLRTIHVECPLYCFPKTSAYHQPATSCFGSSDFL